MNEAVEDVIRWGLDKVRRETEITTNAMSGGATMTGMHEYRQENANESKRKTETRRAMDEDPLKVKRT